MGHSDFLVIDHANERTTYDAVHTQGQKRPLLLDFVSSRTNKAEIRPEEQSEKPENYWENLWNRKKKTVERAI